MYMRHQKIPLLLVCLRGDPILQEQGYVVTLVMNEYLAYFLIYVFVSIEYAKTLREMASANKYLE